MQPIKKQNKHYQKSLCIVNKFSSSQLRSYVFSDGKLIPIRAEMAQRQISNNDNNMLFHLPSASIQVQLSNDEKQKNSNNTVKQHPCNSNVDNELENRHNDNSF